MAIKAGQILHDVHGFVVDRAQSVNSNLNLSQEKIYELGNYQSVATIFDTPDLSWDLESFDMSTEFEALVLGLDPTTTDDGDEFDFLQAKPIDVISPFKDKGGVFTTIRGVIVPYLGLESVAYRFGVGQSSSQTFTMRGDSIYYVPGTPYYQSYANAGNTTYAFAHTALPYVETGDTLFAISVCLKDSTSAVYKRLFFGEDYTNTSGGFTLLEDLSATYDTVHVVYGSLVAATYPQSVHPSDSVKPAAVRSRDLDVFIGTNAATPVFSRWTGVQSFEVTRSVTLDNDSEFGNPHYVSSDYDVADVTGSITVRAVDAEDLWAKIAEIADVPTNEIVGPLSAEPIPLELQVRHPDTGLALKTLYVPDARFAIPAFTPRVQTKLEMTFTFSSDGGNLLVYQGER